MSPETAKTTTDMFRAVAQDGRGQNDGTAPKAAVTGYQISGKTGTAQQFDKSIGRYSQSNYWITFAGIMPADDPRFVVGMVYDKPKYGTPDGVSAAPFFHDVASFLAQRYNIPLSKEASPVVPLVVP
ncbi:penicillin-binding transpeptidase domain-containing protein [Actinokineospora soli]|uniref:Penicillin-binding transpeptidase domain-containing protein n=1 Tax=Actinokineospora soli TaxID=1048753 RepID=A0ABW2TU97_9PSEU